MLILWEITRNLKPLAVIAWLLCMALHVHGQSLTELEQKLQSEKNQKKRVDLLLLIAAEEVIQSRTTKAIERAKQAVLIATDSLKEPKVISKSSLGLARAYMANKQYEAAVEKYFEASNLITQYEPERLWELHKELGMLYAQWGAYEKATEYYQKSLEEIPASNKDAEIGVVKKLAAVQMEMGDYAKAEAFYEYLLPLYETRGREEEKKEVYYQIAIANESEGQYKEAVIRAQEYLFRSQGDALSIIKALNLLGYLKRKLKEGKDSKEYFLKALNLNKQLQAEASENQKADLLTNTGVINANLRDYGEALEAFEEAVEIRKLEGNYDEEAKLYNHIATTYYLRGDLMQAKAIAQQAVHLSQKAHNPQTRQTAYQILANISEATGDFEEYQNYNQLYQQAKERVLENRNKQEQAIVNRKFIIEQLESSLKLTLSEVKQQQLIAENAEKEKELAQAKAEQAEQGRKLQEARAEQAVKDNQLARARADQAVQAKQLAVKQAEKEKAEKELANARAAEALVEAQKADQARQLAEERADRTKAEQEQKLQAQNQDAQFKILLSILLFVILTLGLMLFFFIRNRKKNRLLAAQNEKIKEQNDDLQNKNIEISAQRDKLTLLNKDLNQKSEEIATQRDAIESEKEKSDQLLLNILPWETAKELKEQGKATPKQYELATVLFTDFKGFTKLAEKLSPEEVIEELNYCFIAFDEIIARNNMEKIKTIGDAYMAVGGVPIANHTNPVDAVRAGVEIQAFAREWAVKKQAKGLPPWEIRLGIHTGSLIAGVVGMSKFAFDIWGDAVNLASRMESSGEVGKINISGATYELVKDHFNCVYRGKVKAKNKGEVDMYFVEGLK